MQDDSLNEDRAQRRPLLVSTTLSGNSESVIGEALASAVDWVDLCLVIDTGISDGTMKEVARVAGAKLRTARFPWNGDFSAARNFALEEARRLGATWAVTLDTDERFERGGADVRARLEAGGSEVSVWLARSKGASYSKERFLRLNLEPPLAWIGPTHEALPWRRGERREILEGITVFELPKSPEALRHKFERDVSILRQHTSLHPDDPRWHFYLAESLAGLGDREAAIVAYDRCAMLPGWDEQAAWAAFLAGEHRMHFKRYDEALKSARRGLTRHAGIAELYWLAGFASFWLGRTHDAIGFAFASEALGRFRGHWSEVSRIGFQRPDVLFEKPYDILRHAFRKLGDPARAAHYERLHEEAIVAQVAADKNDPVEAEVHLHVK